tara:strand:+ start:283 stop:396 length:114 start_codon:yes stop_codon:yes gene_type:complete
MVIPDKNDIDLYQDALAFSSIYYSLPPNYPNAKGIKA